MHWKKFVLFNALGAALWVGVWVSIGYFSGSNIDTIYRTATRYELYFAILVGLVILAFIGRHVWRWRKERHEREAATSRESRTPDAPS
jgi:membrane protein DedA with SNARE-associated domain